VNRLETRIPPPVVLAALAALAWWLARQFPQATFPLPQHAWLAAFIAIIGVLLNLLPKLRFGRANTTVNPMRPQNTSALVTAGLYRYTRNPMYVGQALVLLAWAIQLHHAFAFAAPVVFMLYITRFQIKPEERTLLAKFGQPYANYCQRVRRWL
jgi:protein-S-isoprenylcysteine O-methyltransferase Ste14